ncbi:hypothetical protein NPIL_520521 [Nephila pilipes]|uniref:Uncharacterized protein n=1 Tax=Nephila pilipes TaxID=299642 RepID=A0A8X6UII8_NEPPI|nr:hypothetical protein NPIL_520521 [Nephila pilipes]
MWWMFLVSSVYGKSLYTNGVHRGKESTAVVDEMIRDNRKHETRDICTVQCMSKGTGKSTIKLTCSNVKSVHYGYQNIFPLLTRRNEWSSACQLDPF